MTKVRKGSDTPRDIYISVGVALSFWESSEDVIVGVFKRLCGKVEPTAFETYVAAPRSARSKMLESAIKRYKARFIPEEIKEIKSALKALDGLSSVRNQIAHGHVTKYNKRVNDVVVMDGHFLVSSFNELGYQVERKSLAAEDFRFAYTAAEIDEWRQKVRVERARIMQAERTWITREQEFESANPEIARTRHLAETIATRQVSAAYFEIIRKGAVASPPESEES